MDVGVTTLTPAVSALPHWQQTHVVPHAALSILLIDGDKVADKGEVDEELARFADLATTAVCHSSNDSRILLLVVLSDRSHQQAVERTCKQALYRIPLRDTLMMQLVPSYPMISVFYRDQLPDMSDGFVHADGAVVHDLRNHGYFAEVVATVLLADLADRSSSVAAADLVQLEDVCAGFSTQGCHLQVTEEFGFDDNMLSGALETLLKQGGYASSIVGLGAVQPMAAFRCFAALEHLSLSCGTKHPANVSTCQDNATMMLPASRWEEAIAVLRALGLVAEVDGQACFVGMVHEAEELPDDAITHGQLTFETLGAKQDAYGLGSTDLLAVLTSITSPLDVVATGDAFAYRVSRDGAIVQMEMMDSGITVTGQRQDQEVKIELLGASLSVVKQALPLALATMLPALTLQWHDLGLDDAEVDANLLTAETPQDIDDIDRFSSSMFDWEDGVRDSRGSATSFDRTDSSHSMRASFQRGISVKRSLTMSNSFAHLPAPSLAPPSSKLSRAVDAVVPRWARHYSMRPGRLTPVMGVAHWPNIDLFKKRRPSKTPRE